MTIRKDIQATLHWDAGSLTSEMHCWCIPAEVGKYLGEWGGEFDSTEFIPMTREPLNLVTALQETVQVLITEVHTVVRAGSQDCLATFSGIGAPPKELYDPPPVPTHPPAKVKLVMHRFHVEQPAEQFDSIRDALVSAYWSIEHNEAAPWSLEVPSTIIGSGPAKFSSNQIYALVDLVDPEKK